MLKIGERKLESRASEKLELRGCEKPGLPDCEKLENLPDRNPGDIGDSVSLECGLVKDVSSETTNGGAASWVLVAV